MAAVKGAFQQQQQQFGSCVPITIPVLDGPCVSQSVMDRASSNRPVSSLARGIKITEFKETKVNPEPIPLEESELILEEYLSPGKLRDLAGVDDLENVHYLEMKVDTRDTSLGNFGVHLPNLRQLKLSNSIITSVRDLGSSLHNLRVLWMARCGLEDLDGLSSMNSLQELYLAYNDIYDISACSLLENLEILDLEGNNIDEVSQIHFLSTCSKLRHLTLDGNPVCLTPSPDATSDGYDYRQTVREILPHLELLDDEPLSMTDRHSRLSVSAFDADWALIDELMEAGIVDGCDGDVDCADLTAGLPTSPLRPSTGYRPGSALKNYGGTGIRPGTRVGRPGTQSNRPGTSLRPLTSRPSSARPGSSRSGGRPDSSGHGHSGDDIDNIDDASDLTRGGVVCGNPSRALKARHKPKRSQNQSVTKIMQQLNYTPKHSEEVSLENDENIKDLLEEIRQWKAAHSKKQEEIEARKAPQVLKVDHDDAVSLSDDDESIDSELDGENISEHHSTRHHLSRRTNGFEEDDVRGKNESPTPANVRPKSRMRDPSPRSRLRTLRYDESFETVDDTQTVPHDMTEPRQAHRESISKKSAVTGRLPSPSPPQGVRNVNHVMPKPLTPPHRLCPDEDRVGSPAADRPHPVIRALVHSPESQASGGLRSETSHTPPSGTQLPPPRIRKGLHNVQLLPSKFNK